MKNDRMSNDTYGKEAEFLYNKLISAVSVSEQVSLDELREFAKCPEITEDKFVEILREIRDAGVRVLPYEDYPYRKKDFDEMLEKIRSVQSENERSTPLRKGDDPIRLYFKEMEELPILSGYDESDLIFDIADGDEDKKESLIEYCMFIPVAVAFRYIGKNLLFSDLVQEGNMELMAAAEEFDYSENISFIAYAAYRVERKIITLIDEQGEVVTLPSAVAEDAAKIIEENRKSMKENNRELTDTELSEVLNIPPERVKAAKEALERCNSLNSGTAAEN